MGGGAQLSFLWSSTHQCDWHVMNAGELGTSQGGTVCSGQLGTGSDKEAGFSGGWGEGSRLSMLFYVYYYVGIYLEPNAYQAKAE